MPILVDRSAQFGEIIEFLKEYQALQRNFRPGDLSQENFSFGRVIRDLKTVSSSSSEKDVLGIKEM